MTASARLRPVAVAPVHERDRRLWRWAAVVAVVLTALYLVLPRDPVWLRELVVYAGGEAAAVAAVVVGVRRYRPAAPAGWLFIAAGLAWFTAGDVAWTVYELLDQEPFPSPADVLYLSGYPFIALGLSVAVLRRRPLGVDRRAWVDAVIVTVVAAFLGWCFLVQPVLTDPDLTTLESLVAVAYPAGDLLLVAVAARFVIGSSLNVPALRLLLAGLGLTLIGDVAFAAAVVGGAGGGHVTDTTLLLGVLLIGVGALHPSMVTLTEEAGDPGDRHDTLRIVLLAGSVMVPPVVLLVQDVRGATLHLVAAATAMLVLATLVAIRASFVTASLRRGARRERTLSRYAGELLEAGGDDRLFDAARRAAGDLVGDGHAELRLVEGTGPDAAPDGHGFAATIADGRRPVGVLVADAGPARLRRIRHSLSTVATQLSMALERDRLLAAERELAEGLAAQNERLRELDRMKDTFVSSVSHELRTPLTSMVGYLEMLRDGEAGELSEDQARFVEIVERNCHRLNDLIGDILVAARVDSGRLSLDREPLDLKALAATHVESISPVAARHGVEVVLAAADLGPVWADRMRIGQLLDNLLSNAVKFTPAGGRIKVTLERRGDAVHVQVADTGVGIPPAEVDRLFERFFRASTAKAIGGTGLGLSIAKSIAEAHGGTIDVHSEVGVGTTFDVQLPSSDHADSTGGRRTTEVTL